MLKTEDKGWGWGEEPGWQRVRPIVPPLLGAPPLLQPHPQAACPTEAPPLPSNCPHSSKAVLYNWFLQGKPDRKRLKDEKGI